MEFAQSAAVPHLYVAAGNADPTAAVLYLLPRATPSPPATIALADTWSGYVGAYLFLDAPLAAGAEAAFCTSAWAYLGDPRMQGTRFVWFAAAEASALLDGTPVAVFQPVAEGPVVTAQPARFAFRNLALTLARGATVVPDAVNGAFVFTPAASGDIAVVARSGGVTIDGVTGSLTVPLTGALAGCLQFGLTLDQQNLADLDIGLRYFHAVNPTDPPRQGEDFFLASLRYPIFAAGLVLYANLDPLAPLNAARSFLAFNASDAGQAANGAAAAVASNYSTSLGYGLSLTPLAAGAAQTAFAALVFATNQQASAASAHDPFYLVPRGDFVLTAPVGATVGAMGGLSGVEFFSIESATSIVSFVPAQDAFAPGFAPGEVPGFTAPLSPVTPPTTALATLGTPRGQVDYFAQPDQAVLHNTGGTFGTGATTIAPLAPVQVQAATLAWPPDTAAGAVFPWLPYGGLNGADFAPYRQLESQIASPRRRRALTGGATKAVPRAAAAHAAGLSPYSTTPQGFLASYTGGVVESMDVVLAKMASGSELVLTGVSGDLLAAFQSNKMFLVVSDPAEISAYLAATAQITVGGDASETWKFMLGPDTWTSTVRPGTILIVKFFDEPLDQLVGLQSAWSFPSTFNTDPNRTATTIAGMIQAATASNDPDYDAFLDAATRASWNGILVLNALAPLTELPAELAGLAPGIDQNLFYAHHIGIDASKILNHGGSLDIAASSIFGLINYVVGDIAPSGDPFAFEVQQLKVLFLNSTVAAFSSVIELEINSLFGEPAALEPVATSNNIVKLYGVCQTHVVAGQEIDTYVFTTQAGEPSVFDMTSSVLNAVQLSQGQFVTVTADDPATTTVARFQFWGLLDFAALEGFDVFSFGREADAASPSGLSFGNLVIQMTSHPQTPDVPPVYVFDASALSLDMASSVSRAGGFHSHFPLTVNGFTQAKAGTTPQALGFMGLQTPLTQASLAFPWYSLNFNVNLGSPGALAAQAGFVATLTAAWSPTLGANYSVFTGLSLPGSSGAKRQVTIEGLFDITFKTLEIVAVGTTYIMVLYDIGFSFLSFTFPPSGQVNFVLFGDPGAPSGNTSLGWYAAYAKAVPKKSTGTSRSGLLAAPAAMLALAPPGVR